MPEELREKRIAAYRQANDAVKTLYGSLELGDTLGGISEKLALKQASKDSFINIVGDIILGFYPKSQFQTLLTKEIDVPKEIADGIARDLAAFFELIGAGTNTFEDSTLPEANASLKERLDLRPDGTRVGTTPAENPVQAVPKPLTREELMNALSGKRTMASDIEAVRHGYENQTPKTENRPGVYTAPQAQQEEGE